MFETWSGMPLPVQFLLSFLIILGVIGAIWWTVRRFGSGRLGSNTRGRQPRLAVIDYASVDNRRRLILVRRDNIEHLLMIGGPTDIVVEPNIVRAVPATRDVARAPAGIEAITRAIPLPDNGSGSWPLQPDTNGGARPGVRPDTPHEDIPGRPHAEPRQRDTLAALADELSTRMPPRNRGSVAEPPRSDQRPEQRQEPRQEQRQEQRTEPRLEPRKPVQAAGPASPPPSSAGATSEGAAGGEQSLADMAQRLEAALRKPSGEARPGSPARPAASPEASRSDSSPPAPARNSRAGEQRPASADAGKSNQNKTAIYDTLEQEMANLLGRPSKS
jgi:hypothetical protein